MYIHISNAYLRYNSNSSQLLAVIGEQLATDEEICGAVISVRKSFYRIALWIKTSDDEEKIEKIRYTRAQFFEEKHMQTHYILYSQQIRDTLNLAEDIPIEFTAHRESPAKVAAALAAASLEENAATGAEEAASVEEATSAEEAAPAKNEA